MEKETKRKCRKAFTVIGAFLILLPNGVAMYWGNLSVYVNSYIVVCLGTTAGVEDPWVVSMFVLFWTLGVIIYDYVQRFFGKRWGAVFGAFVTNIGFSCTYFSVQHSFAMLNVTLAMLTGIGTGHLQAHGLRLLIDWADGDYGLMVAIVQAAFQMGASITNQLVTLYLNPINAVPNLKIDSSVYFTQKHILDKVPFLFICMACVAVALQVVGHFLMSENTFKEPNMKMGGDQINGSHNLEEGDNRSNNSTHRSSGDSTTFLSDSKTSGPGENATPVLEENVNSYDDDSIDYSPHQVLKSASFYFIWLVFFFAEYPFVLLANYYKSFGQIWIHDDHFLADLGTVYSYVNVVMRIVWGIAMDKIGVRKCLIIEIVLVVFISGWYYFAARTNRWLFFVVTNVYAGLASVIFGSVAVTVVSMYGRRHFSTNYGLIRSSLLFLSLICPFVTQAILGNFGWFYIFAAAGISNIIALVIILFCLKEF